MAKRAVAKKPPETTLGFDPKTLGIKGFERLEYVPKSSYKDSSMFIIAPTRTVEMVDPETGEKSRQPMIHRSVIQAWNSLQWPMNAPRYFSLVGGAEVGDAYTEQVAAVLAHPDLKKWKYVLTLEDDNLPPPNAVLSLLDAIDQGPFDAVGALYFTKGELQMPQAYGDPYEFSQTGVLDFRPRDVTEAVHCGGILPVNGIAMGCSLFRMDVFKKIEAPWFKSSPSGTQDLFMCAKMKRAGMNLAVDCRVPVGHLDIRDGTVY